MANRSLQLTTGAARLTRLALLLALATASTTGFSATHNGRSSNSEQGRQFQVVKRNSHRINPNRRPLTSTSSPDYQSFWAAAARLQTDTPTQQQVGSHQSSTGQHSSIKSPDSYINTWNRTYLLQLLHKRKTRARGHTNHASHLPSHRRYRYEALPRQPISLILLRERRQAKTGLAIEINKTMEFSVNPLLGTDKDSYSTAIFVSSNTTVISIPSSSETLPMSISSSFDATPILYFSASSAVPSSLFTSSHPDTTVFRQSLRYDTDTVLTTESSIQKTSLSDLAQIKSEESFTSAEFSSATSVRAENTERVSTSISVFNSQVDVSSLTRTSEPVFATRDASTSLTLKPVTLTPSSSKDLGIFTSTVDRLLSSTTPNLSTLSSTPTLTASFESSSLTNHYTASPSVTFTQSSLLDTARHYTSFSPLPTDLLASIEDYSIAESQTANEVITATPSYSLPDSSLIPVQTSQSDGDSTQSTKPTFAVSESPGIKTSSPNVTPNTNYPNVSPTSDRNQTTGPAVLLLHDTDDKEWAVPVTVCLSLVSCVALVLAILACYRLKSRAHRHGSRLNNPQPGAGFTSLPNQQNTRAQTPLRKKTVPAPLPPVNPNKLTASSFNDGPRYQTSLISNHGHVKERPGAAHPNSSTGRSRGHDIEMTDLGQTQDVEIQDLAQTPNPGPSPQWTRDQSHETRLTGESDSSDSHEEERRVSDGSSSNSDIHSAQSGTHDASRRQPLCGNPESSHSGTDSDESPRSSLRRDLRSWPSGVNSSHSRLTPAQTSYVADSEDDHKTQYLNRGLAYHEVHPDKTTRQPADLDQEECMQAEAGSQPLRPAISKCVSFDETQLRSSGSGRLSTVPKLKSPIRKISTMSDSATYFPTHPDQSFGNVASYYATVDNLTAEIDYDFRPTPRFSVSSSSDSISIEDNEPYQPGHRGHPMALKSNSYPESPHKVASSGTKGITATADSKTASEDKDDYVFPLVRKAKLKILADRENRKQELLLANNLVGNTETESSRSTALSQERPPGSVEWAKPVRYLPRPDPSTATARYLPRLDHSPATATTTILTRPIKIPSIILNDDREKKNVQFYQDKSSPIPTLFRRVPRANNPFLIEADPVMKIKSDKLRRSSAPAMGRDQDPLRPKSQNDGMTRSSSGQQLYLDTHESDQHSPLSPKALSSDDVSNSRTSSVDFHDMVRVLEEDSAHGGDNNHRLKQLIDERYNALFHHRAPPIPLSHSVDRLHDSSAYMTALSAHSDDTSHPHPNWPGKPRDRLVVPAAQSSDLLATSEPVTAADSTTTDALNVFRSSEQKNMPKENGFKMQGQKISNQVAQEDNSPSGTPGSHYSDNDGNKTRKVSLSRLRWNSFEDDFVPWHQRRHSRRSQEIRTHNAEELDSLSQAASAKEAGKEALPHTTSGNSVEILLNQKPSDIGSQRDLQKEDTFSLNKSETGGFSDRQSDIRDLVESLPTGRTKQSPSLIPSSYKSWRSASLSEDSRLPSPRDKRAASLATDQPSQHSNGLGNWDQLFGEEALDFLSSAHNTALQHPSQTGQPSPSVYVFVPGPAAGQEQSVTRFREIPEQGRQDSRGGTLILPEQGRQDSRGGTLILPEQGRQDSSSGTLTLQEKGRKDSRGAPLTLRDPYMGALQVSYI